MEAKALTRWEAIQKSVEEPIYGGGAPRWIYGGIALLLLLGFYLIYRISRRRASSRALQKTIERLSLGESEAEVLQDLAAHYSAALPGRIARDADVFEKAVHKYLEAHDESLPKTHSILTTLRRKLGFGREKGRILHSSRQISKKDLIRLHIGGQTRDSRVAWVGSHVLTLHLPDDAEDLKPGQRLQVTVLSNAGRYGFSSRVESLNEQQNECRIEHTVDIERKDRRRYRRIAMRGPVRCRPADHPRASWQDMELRDLSLCGAKLLGANVFGQKLCPDDEEERIHRVELQFRPAAFVQDRDEEELQRDLNICGRLVSKEKAAADRFIYRIDLDDASHDQMRVLSRLLYLVETNDRR